MTNPLAAMKDGERGRPILFSAPMVRALLAGTKTQTRRPFKGIEDVGNGVFHINTPGGGLIGLSEENVQKWAPDYVRIAVGDRLWVREAWAPLDALTHGDPGVQALADRGFYRADGSTVDGEISRWRPSIHMPRWASRLTLIVTDVRVQRLQDLSEEDARAEGCDDGGCLNCGGSSVAAEGCCYAPAPSYRDSYAHLWDSINGAGSWDANPWCVAYTFTVHASNIDALPPASAEESR